MGSKQPSSWGVSWSDSWGFSWGFVGGGGASQNRGAKKKTRGWANEMAILEESLRKVEEQTAPVEAPIQHKTPEVSDGSELYKEAFKLKLEIELERNKYLQGRITLAEYQTFKKRNDDALATLLMALELDKYVFFSII